MAPKKGKRKTPGRDEHGMTPKQRLFSDGYLLHGNGVRAAREAGHKGSDNTLAQVARQNLRKAHIKAYIEERQRVVRDAAAKKYEVTTERITAELARIGFADINEVASWGEDGVRFVPSEQLGEDQTRAIKSISSKRTVRRTEEGGDVVEDVTLKVEHYDKRQALVDLGKHLGMFVERREITGANGQPFEVRWADEEEQDPDAG